MPEPPLLAILDGFRPGSLALLNAILLGGCRWVSLRAPGWTTQQRRAALALLVPVCEPFGAILSVHGDLEAALSGRLTALHLPRHGDVAAARARLGDRALIGVSAHDRAEARRAERAGADYLTVSPFAETASKPGYGPALGMAGFAAIARSVSLPCLALGGIDSAETAAAAMAAGAGGVAVMGGLARQADPAAGTESLLAAIARARGSP